MQQVTPNQYRSLTYVREDDEGKLYFPFEFFDKYSDFTVLIDGEPCKTVFASQNDSAQIACYLQTPTSLNNDPFVVLEIQYSLSRDQDDFIIAQYDVVVTEYWENNESHEIAIYYNKRKTVSTDDIWVYAYNVEDPNYCEWLSLTNMLNFLGQAISQGILQDYQFYAHGYLEEPAQNGPQNA